MGKNIYHTVVLTALLFAVGLLTRLPALQLQAFYGLHAAFAAPFYAFICAYYIQRFQKWIPCCIAFLICAAILGTMKPMMGSAFIFPAAAIAITALCTRKTALEKRSVLIGSIGTIVFYPMTLVIGIVGGGFLTSVGSEKGLQILIIAIISCGLALLGAILGETVATKRKHAIKQEPES